MVTGCVTPTQSGGVNRTTSERFAKEFNFHPVYVNDWMTYLFGGGVVSSANFRSFDAGPRFDGFWSRDLDSWREIDRQAVDRIIRLHCDSFGWQPRDFEAMFQFAVIFATALRGQAIPCDQLVPFLTAFMDLTDADYHALGNEAGLNSSGLLISEWKRLLRTASAKKKLHEAFHAADWAYDVKFSQQRWFCFRANAVAVHTDKSPLERVELRDRFDVEGKTITVGMGIDAAAMITLFSTCNATRTEDRQDIQFQLKLSRVQQSPHADHLRTLLEERGGSPELTETVASVEVTKAGRMKLRQCSGVVFADHEVLKAIRATKNLKGYILPHSPKECLLIKPESSIHNFYTRCRDAGFAVEVQ